MSLRVAAEQAIVRPRPDLHRDAETGYRDTAAALGRYVLDGKSALGFVQLIEMGPSGFVAPGRDLPDVEPGAVCLVDLAHLGQEVVLDGQRVYSMGASWLRAEVRVMPWERDPSVEVVDRSVLPRPLMAEVLTERDPEGFVRGMYGPDTALASVQLSEGILRDGMPADDMRLNRLKFVYERVRAMGPGRVVTDGTGTGKNRRRYFSPTDPTLIGMRACFSPVRSLHWVASGARHFKLTPFSDIRFALS